MDAEWGSVLNGPNFAERGLPHGCHLNSRSGIREGETGGEKEERKKEEEGRQSGYKTDPETGKSGGRKRAH